jgi:holo-[acyl-carrier protein] synthase
VNTLSVGVDLVEIQRVRAMLERHGIRAVRRLLTELELDYCAQRSNVAQHVAGRLAAKEATYKALQVVDGATDVRWLDIEVITNDGGRPTLKLHGRADLAARRLRAEDTLLSISHSIDTAIAMVVLIG